MYKLANKLRHVKDNIRIWNKESFGNIFSNKAKISSNLKDIQDSIQISRYEKIPKEKESETLIKYHDMVHKEEVFWKQRSRNTWLRERDRNSKFFHLSAIKHKVANRISKLRVNKNFLDKEEDIAKEAKDYFLNLLTQDFDLDQNSQQDILAKIPKILFDQDNIFLKAIPSNEEIKKVVFSFEGSKSPGPDGFPMFFFQMYWSVVGKDVTDAVKEFFGAKRILKEVNGTFISLIPKKAGADTMDNFRSISLCNSSYKIISKVITSRLLTLLPKLISHQQNGFVLGKHILDSIITVHDNIHSLMMDKKEGFIMKIDLSKAYDIVDWSLLERSFLAFGFNRCCTKILMQLVTLASFSMLVNGSPTPFFKSSRGLSQGDPLSPILFVIMVECLGRYIDSTIQRGDLKGLRPSSSNHVCSHQQFVDDSIFLGEALVVEAKNLKTYLNNYSKASGRTINWNKSSLYFINVPENRQRKIKKILGCQIGKLLATYLGLPLGLNPLDSFWSPTVDKFHKKLAGWKGTLLSQAGKVQLLKSSFQRFPSMLLVFLESLIILLKLLRKSKENFFGLALRRREEWFLSPRIRSVYPNLKGDLGLEGSKT